MMAAADLLATRLTHPATGPATAVGPAMAEELEATAAPTTTAGSGSMSRIRTWAEEDVVMHVGKRGRVLKVGVRFEPSRIGRDCLAGAYEQIVPIIRRSLPVSGQYGAVPAGQALRRAAGAER